MWVGFCFLKKELESKDTDWSNQAKNVTFLERKTCPEREKERGIHPLSSQFEPGFLFFVFLFLEEGVYV